MDGRLMGWKSFPEDIREGGYRRPDESQAKADVEAEGPERERPPVESVSRPDARRSASATSEIMDATAGETAPFMDWVPLAKALFEIERDPTIKDQAWFDFQGKAQRLVAIMSQQPQN